MLQSWVPGRDHWLMWKVCKQQAAAGFSLGDVTGTVEHSLNRDQCPAHPAQVITLTNTTDRMATGGVHCFDSLLVTL